MKRLVLLSIIIIQLLALLGCSAETSNKATGNPAAKTSLKKLNGGTVEIAELEAFIEQTMKKANVAGLSCAIINDAQLVYQKAFGYKNAVDGTLNDQNTLFSAASFSKTVFATLVMQLAEDRVIDLDRPLYQYLEKPLVEYPAYADLKGDDRYQQITARMALSHTTGFPNWRFLTEEGKLSILFTPGTQFNYSGEGIALLQMVVEVITGKDLETLAQERIFKPLGMTRTSYVWQPEFEANYASPHDEYGRPRGENIQRATPDAAGSMVTTAGDYARVLVSILNAAWQRKATFDAMLTPQIFINDRQMFGSDAWNDTAEVQAIHLAWGLGWGRFDAPSGRAFFHTGHTFGWQNYTVTYVDQGTGIVLLSNSDNFESVAEEIVKKATGDFYSPFHWLGYVPFDPAAQKKTPPPDAVSIQVDPAILAAYAGTYDMQPTAVFHFKFEENRLLIQSLDGQGWAPLSAESETQFFVPGQEGYQFTFIKDGDGAVTGLKLMYLGIEMPMAKKME